MRWHVPIIPALGRWKSKDHDFETGLDYIVISRPVWAAMRMCLKKTNEIKPKRIQTSLFWWVIVILLFPLFLLWLYFLIDIWPETLCKEHWITILFTSLECLHSGIELLFIFRFLVSREIATEEKLNRHCWWMHQNITDKLTVVL